MAQVIRRLVYALRCFVEFLDREKVQAFQGMYYVLFMLGALVLWVLPNADIGQVDDMLGQTSYRAWLLMNFVCPPLTLIGRHITSRAAMKAHDEPNGAWGAAWLQLVGDFGVWSGVNVFVYERFRYDPVWWREDVYTALFMLMGVLGGLMFTFRSVRRLVSIKRSVRHDKRQSG
jgi:hypothetical protein